MEVKYHTLELKYMHLDTINPGLDLVLNRIETLILVYV